MTDIDTIADGLASQIAGAYLVDEVTFLERHAAAIRVVKSALQSYGDACAKQMREEALEQVKYRLNVFGGEPTTLNERSILNHVSRAILAIPLHSEKVKP